jgi:type III restriction enzyme
LFDQATERVSQRPDFSVLDKPLLAKVDYDEKTGEITVTGSISQDEKKAFQECFTSPQDREAIERLYLLKLDRQVGSPAKAEVRPEFKVPLLAVREGDQLEVFEESCFKEIDWNLADCDACLTEGEFPSQQAAGEVGEVDVSEAGRVELRFVNQLHQQLTLLTFEPGWTVASLANWLDRQIPHMEIVQSQSAPFIHKALSHLIESRGLTVEHLARQKFRLRTALETKIDAHRHAQAKTAYNALLFGAGTGKIEVSKHLYFTFEENRYSPNSFYEGSYKFNKHYFAKVGELPSEGEEFECAVFLDMHPKVWYWVRNLPRREYSFWLQTSTDRSYPDFVALLHDGRILVVEYKGGYLWGNPDSEEKLRLGELWAERSGGSCLFVMPKGKDWSAIEALLQIPPRSGALF